MELIKKIFIDEKYTNTKAIRAAMGTLALTVLTAIGLDTVAVPTDEQVSSAAVTLVMGGIATVAQYLLVFWTSNEEKANDETGE